MSLIFCPTPQRLTNRGSRFPLPATLKIVGEVGKVGVDRVEAWSNWATAITGCTIEAERGYPFEVKLTDAGPDGEAYELAVSSDGATARSSSITGLRNALSTFLQMMLNGSLIECHIQDEPALKTRGFMLDVSRDKSPTLQTLKELAHLLALLKYNQLQLYIEHTFAFRGHGLVWGKASPLSAEEIRELDVYTANLGVELAPNLNSLGHMERWLAHRDYRHLAECPDGVTLPNGRVLEVGTTLAPGPAANAFLESLYSEYLPAFSSRKFNCGLDEPWELGMGASRDRCEREGKQAVYLKHLQDVSELAAKHGKELMFWADIVLQDPKSVEQLPKSVTGLIWGYEADHPFDEQARRFAAQGIPFLLCPGTSCWNSIGGRWPTAQQNIMIAARAARAHGADGILLTEWGDNGHHHPLSTIIPALVLNAAVCWNPDSVGDIAAAVDKLAVGDACGQCGKALLELGSVWQSVPTTPFNSSVLFRILLGGEQVRRKALETITPESLHEILERLVQIRNRLRDAQPKRFGGQVIVRELENAVALLEVAARFGLRELEGNEDPSLENDFSRAIGEFEHLWVSRNRIGGLYESTRRLRQAGSGKDMIL